MKTVNKDIVKEFEGLRLEAYKCPAGVWTIGYGHTRGVIPGDVITEAEAEALLAEDLEDSEDAVRAFVNVELNQNQFDALVSFVYNLGSGNFNSSTLLRKLNNGDYLGAANEFNRWNKAGGVVLSGLVRRRNAEANLFIGVNKWI